MKRRSFLMTGTGLPLLTIPTKEKKQEDLYACIQIARIEAFLFINRKGDMYTTDWTYLGTAIFHDLPSFHYRYKLNEPVIPIITTV